MGLAAWGTTLVAAHEWGTRLYARRPASHLAFAPLVAWPRASVPAAILIPAVVGVAAVVVAPAVTRSLRWRVLLWASFVAAAAWAMVLAAAEGSRGIIGPVGLPNDYARELPVVVSGGVGGFLRSFVRGVNRVEFTQHVRAHPPGIAVTLWAVAKIGLRGPWVEAALFIAAGAAVVPAALMSLRDVAGEPGARAAASFLVLAPAAIWVATSGDALIAGVSAWAVAFLVLATSSKHRRSDALAVAGGAAFGAAAMLSYGGPLLALVAMPVAVRRRRVRPVLVAGVCALLVVAAFRAGGFWWWDGLHASVRAYRTGVSRFRPQSYFWFGNVGAFAVVVGPATAMALGRLRDERIWLLVGGALVALALADATGLSRGEVERIWLPFAPWVLLATAAFGSRRIPGHDRILRTALALNVALAVAVEAFLHTTW